MTTFQDLIEECKVLLILHYVQNHNTKSTVQCCQCSKHFALFLTHKSQGEQSGSLKQKTALILLFSFLATSESLRNYKTN